MMHTRRSLSVNTRIALSARCNDMASGKMRPSGVFSAGNGPAMRSAILGMYFADNVAARRVHVETSLVLTHTDPLALSGALTVTEIAARLASDEWVRRPTTGELTAVLRNLSSQAEWQEAVQSIRECCEASILLSLAVECFGPRKGVFGYMLRSMLFAIVAWYHH